MAERRQQVEELFYAVLDRPLQERDSFLSEACASDPLLRIEVESLISAHEQSGSFLDSPAYEVATRTIPETEAESLAGLTIGHYVIQDLLGKGGMGHVYLAIDTKLDRKVALKLLPPKFAADQLRLRRLTLEAKAASSLNHPNIITIHEIGQSESVPFIAMEYIEGETLRRRLARGPIPISETLDVIIQVTNALCSAHNAGIVHRDIKPENIMVRPDGYVKVLDFGLAKLTERQNPEPNPRATAPAILETDPDVIMGTVNYMSPEQMSGRGIDARSDIFSLGIVIFEMVAGRSPFTGDTHADVFTRIAKAEPPLLADFVPYVPASLQRLVSRALSKEKEQRQQTSEELLAELKAVKQEWESASGHATTNEIKTEPLSIPKQSTFSLPIAVMIGALLLLLALAARAVFRPKPADPSAVYAALQPFVVDKWQYVGKGRGAGMRLSPDGSMIAYSPSQYSPVGQAIFVKLIQAGREIRVTHDEWLNSNPIWSSDSQEIAYFSKRGEQTGIWSIPALGGTQTLLTVIEQETPELIHWSQDRSTIFYELDNNLFARNLVTNEISQITRFDFPDGPRLFTISPDEKRIAYREVRNQQADIWIMEMASGEARQITNTPEDDWTPHWLDNERILFSSDRSDNPDLPSTYQINVAYLDGREPIQVTRGEGRYEVGGVSADGTKVLYTSPEETSDLYQIDLTSEKEMVVADGFEFDLWPDISPDGKTMAFQSISDPFAFLGSLHSKIIVKPLAEEGQETRIISDGYLARWMPPDGRRLSFLRWTDSDKVANIWSINADGTDERQVTTAGITYGGVNPLSNTRLTISDYGWSPDGSKLVYCSKKSGQQQVWLAAMDGAGEINLTNNLDPDLVFTSPLWSPDGSRLAFVSYPFPPTDDARAVWKIWLVEKDKPAAIFSSNGYLRLLGWSASGEELFLSKSKASARPGDISLIRISTRTHPSQRFAQLHNAYRSNVHLSPSGRLIAYTSRVDDRDNIWLVSTATGQPRQITTNENSRLRISSLAWSPNEKSIFYGKQESRTVVSMFDNFK